MKAKSTYFIYWQPENTFMLNQFLLMRQDGQDGKTAVTGKLFFSLMIYNLVR